MQKFERDYAELVAEVLHIGKARNTRNGRTFGVFGRSLTVEINDAYFPLPQGRQMFYAGILGEFAAFMRGPTSVQDFKQFGCNYWEKFASPDGSLVLDYGNSWFDFNGVNQIAELKRMLREDPMNRRMIVSAWRPDRLKELSLPCCHYSYQFYVEEGSLEDTLHMIWTQRSVDMMLGLPSDIVLAAIWLIVLAKELGFRAGSIKMDFGDCHIYEEHFVNAQTYVNLVRYGAKKPPVSYFVKPSVTLETFVPSDITICDYRHGPKLNFELKE